MKRFTFISALILCGLTGVQAQKNFDFFQKNVTETVHSQSNLMVLDNEDSPKFTLTGKILTTKNLESGVQVDIYSVLGAKVYTFVYRGSPETLNLNKGIYIIRVGKYTQKIIL